MYLKSRTVHHRQMCVLTCALPVSKRAKVCPPSCSLDAEPHFRLGWRLQNRAACGNSVAYSLGRADWFAIDSPMVSW